MSAGEAGSIEGRGLAKCPVAAAGELHRLTGTQATEVAVSDGGAAVAEEVADDAQASAFTFESDGVGVPQTVRVNALLDASPSCQARQQVADVALVNAVTPERAENRRSTVDASLPAHVEPACEQRGAPGVESDDAVLITLPPLHRHRPVIEVDVLRAEREHLADPKPASPGEPDQRSVANPGWGTARAGANKRLDLRARQKISLESAGIGDTGHEFTLESRFQT